MRLTSFGALALLLVVVAGPVRAQTEALSLGDVLGLRERGVSTHQILHYAQVYCIGFLMTDSIVSSLRTAGADSALIGGLRATCTTDAPLTHRTPGTLLDVDFASAQALPGTTSSDGLCRASFDKRGLRFENRQFDSACIIDYPSDAIPAQASLEVTVDGLTASSDGGAVLGFGRQPGIPGEYLLAIGRYHTVTLSRIDAGTSHTLVDRYDSGIGSTASGRDVMRVDIHGRQLTVSVNGKIIGVAQAPENVVGGLMLGVGPRTILVFEHLRVWGPGQDAVARK